MDIDVLGSLTVREGGAPVALTAPKPRQLLAVLAMHADRTVPVPLLIEELWDGRPPRSARNTLQTYILQLRELIGQALRLAGDSHDAKRVLVTEPDGYRLDTRGGAIDTHEFERRAASGYRAMAQEDFAAASRRLHDALALWQGPAFAGIRTGALLEMEIRRLEEARLCALDQRIEADLRLGRHRELVGELTVLASRHRMHESLHRQLMIALHRSGRRAEALAAYQRLRTSLVRDLGLEPSPALRRLQHSMLASGPEREAVEPAWGQLAHTG